MDSDQEIHQNVVLFKVRFTLRTSCDPAIPSTQRLDPARNIQVKWRSSEGVPVSVFRQAVHIAPNVWFFLRKRY
jgi:hypothetical protein